MPKFSRRQLFRLRLSDVTREVGKSAAQNGAEDEEEPFLRPPGALEDEDAFLETCERCQACAEACPFGVIHHFGPVAGQLEKTPFVDPASVPCRWCEDMPCVRACPSGALKLDEGEEVAPIAKVLLQPDKCLTTQGILCDTCSWRCPAGVKAIRMVARKPVLEVDRCTGCGMCVVFCEAEPSAFKLDYDDGAASNESSSGAPVNERKNASKSSFS